MLQLFLRRVRGCSGTTCLARMVRVEVRGNLHVRLEARDLPPVGVALHRDVQPAKQRLPTFLLVGRVVCDQDQACARAEHRLPTAHKVLQRLHLRGRGAATQSGNNGEKCATKEGASH